MFCKNGAKGEITVFANSRDIASVSGYKRKTGSIFLGKNTVLTIKTKTDNALKKRRYKNF
ncbi:MAG: hypothetical protein L6V93_15585 [Clostridiales bacterium]|nr:MAG: hypothetical protein L6V93_15585 [Clostridiales bacterium]